MTAAMTHQIVNDELVEKLAKNSDGWLFLEPHPDFKGQWKVSAFDTGWYFDYKDIVGPYRAVSPASLEKFMNRAKELDHQVAFFEEPTTILKDFEGLNDPPDIHLHSNMEGTINGLLPFQVQAFNFLKDLDGGVMLHDTGTGKSVGATALLKHHFKNDNIDLAWFVCKSHNKVNVQRLLKKIGDMDSVILDGPRKKRERIYQEIAQGEHKIIVTNYEKFRIDKNDILQFFEGTRVAVIWDEAPTKLKNRITRLYKAVCECLYTTKPPIVRKDRKRPKVLKQWILSATPIENDPEDYFNVIRLADPSVFGSVQSFHDEYVASYSFFNPHLPAKWHNLDRMGMVAAHVTHQVSKEDPDIASQFPLVQEIPYYIDWDPKHRTIYDKIAKKAQEFDLDETNILSLITVMQMYCNAPTMLTRSASFRQEYESAVMEWIEQGGKQPDPKGSEAAMRIVESIGGQLTDENHTKLETLRELLVEEHPNEKVLIFSHFNESFLPILSKCLDSWEVGHVVYTGKQKEEDLFKEDAQIRAFVSSDKGSDSLNLEQASVVINMDLPWKWSTYTQRQNRAHRITSQHKRVISYNLLMADSVEDRKETILRRKQGFHEQVFKGTAEQSQSARMTKEDLLYLLG